MTVPAIRPVRPALLFIGVTTGASAITRVFPRWAEALGLDAELLGVDLPIGAPASVYRDVVEAIQAAPLARGALVTTHKIDLFRAAEDLFDEIGETAARLGEVSCLVHRGDRLFAEALDPRTAGAALAAFMPAGHWRRSRAGVLCLGAGGAALALVWRLLGAPAEERPRRIIVSDVRSGRLESMAHHLEERPGHEILEYHEVASAADNEALMHGLQPGSLVINATGLGKDRPGSPVTEAAPWPEGGFVFELNYRGPRPFLDQARARADALGLTVEDGWTYFLHGWTGVIAPVFGVDIAPDGPLFARLGAIAAETMGR